VHGAVSWIGIRGAKPFTRGDARTDAKTDARIGARIGPG